MIQRTIPELITRYDLEPQIRDVYVEGVRDRDIVAWFLRRAGRTDAKVFEVDFIDVPAALLVEYGFSSGNKQRVLVLAKELERALTEEMAQATCIVDGDSDRLLGIDRVSGITYVTDFSCMEMYLFDENHLGKFLELAVGAQGLDVRELLNEYSGVLKTLFMVRTAALSLGIPLHLVDFTRCCLKSAGILTFDLKEFVQRSLDASRLRQREEDVLREIERLKGRAEGDARLYINGEDFLNLLAWERQEILRKRGLRDCDAVFTALRGCLEFAEVSKHGLFEILLQRTAVG